MTGIIGLFGGNPKVAPTAPPPAPRIGDAAGEAAARAARYRARKQKGTSDSILAGSLGEVGTSMPVAPKRSTLG